MALTNVWLAGYGGPPPAASGATAVWLAPNDGTVPSATLVTLVGWEGPVTGATPIWIAGYGGPPPAAIGAIPICISGWGGSGGAPVVTGHRYWRLNITATSGGSFIAVAEFQFRTAAGVPLLFSGGTASASSEAFGTLAGMASDNDPATNWIANAPPQSWTYDYGAGNTKSVVEISIQARSDSAATSQSPTIFTPQWSDDGAAWTSMAQITTAAWTTGGQIQTFAVTPASTTSVWSAADAAASGSNLTLSNGGLTVANTVDSVTRSIRNTISKTSGKVYVEFKCNAIDAASYGLWGLASAGLDLANYLGGSNYSVGIYNGGTTFVSAGFTSNYGTALVPAIGDVFALAVDFAAGSVWIAKNNVWANSSNPATGSLPVASFVPATVGALFAGQSFRFVGNSWTLQSTAASQKYAPPSGFSAWDGGVAPPPTSVWSSSDATANGMTLSNGGLTANVTAASLHNVWQILRGSISKTAGKLYFELKTNTSAAAPYHIGLASSGVNINSYLGDSNYSAGMNVFVGAAFVSTGFVIPIVPLFGALNANDVIGIAVDFTAAKGWLSLNNVWQSGLGVEERDPVTGLNPNVTFTPATVGALFPAMAFATSGADGSWTLQATAASQKYVPPSGFSPWG